MNEDELKKILASNLIHYRKLANLTQGNLAEVLNYSDKSISKWERGEGVPDLLVLTKLADLYHITVNDLLSPKQKKHIPNQAKKKVLVTLLSVCILWLIAVTLFVLLNLFVPTFVNSWLIFIYAIPLTAIIVLIFSSVWGNKIIWCVSTSILVWGVISSVYISFLQYNIWTIFLIGIPLQALIIMWFFFRNTLNKVITKFERKK